EERRGRAGLAAHVRAHAGELAALETALAWADALGAAAVFAERYGCTRPLLVGAELALAEARHPLLLFGGRPVVPLDLRVPADRRGLAITGPNASGNTGASTTLGRRALMSPARLFIPAAEGSRLPLLQAILA